MLFTFLLTISKNFTTVVTLYDGDRLIKTGFVECVAGATSFCADIPYSESDTVKIIFWDSLENMAPLDDFMTACIDS